ncbi:hypothetical protein AcW1_002143 [Taiwanofungus camphoratus]|nr:hypothetical protein AcW1_002141 [Antrodia cinnamomea]KAI0944430.1 hypothetical protein AcW1_002143 [Antrodia cinnamomea]
MLGSFVLNALPIPREPSPRRANSTRSRSLLHSAPLPSSTTATTLRARASRWVRRRTRCGCASTRGGARGRAIVLEKRGQRAEIGQQMFRVR